MTRNTLGDLSLHLFEQLERLNDEDTQGEHLESEIKRAKAVAGIANQIIQTGNLVLKAQKQYIEDMPQNSKKPHMLEAEIDRPVIQKPIESNNEKSTEA